MTVLYCIDKLQISEILLILYLSLDLGVLFYFVNIFYFGWCCQPEPEQVETRPVYTRSHRDWWREAPGTDHPHVLKWLSTAEWVCTPASAVLLYSPGKVEGSGGRQCFDDSNTLTRTVSFSLQISKTTIPRHLLAQVY